MKTMIRIAVLAVTLSGCSLAKVVVTGHQYGPTDPESVKIYQTDKPAGRYEELGRVSVSKFTWYAMPVSEEKVVKELRKKVASIGGNGVMGIQEDFASLNAVAIRTN